MLFDELVCFGDLFSSIYSHERNSYPETLYIHMIIFPRSCKMFIHVIMLNMSRVIKNTFSVFSPKNKDNVYNHDHILIRQ